MIVQMRVAKEDDSDCGGLPPSASKECLHNRRNSMSISIDLISGAYSSHGSARLYDYWKVFVALNMVQDT